jgi:hypothetical protein
MILGTLALAGALLAGSHTVPAPSPTVTASAYEAGDPDTTSQAGTGTTSSPDGPVWAHDNVIRTVTATPDASAPDTWDVTVVTNGQYVANASPITGNTWHGTGAMAGYVQYVVTVPSGDVPSAHNLPRTVPAGTSGMDLIDQLFGQPSGSSNITTVSIGNNGQYDFVYTGIPGAPGGLYFQHS